LQYLSVILSSRRTFKLYLDMNKIDFEKFERLYKDNKTPQFITALIKCYSKDETSADLILTRFPAFKNERFWDGKFWKGSFNDVLVSLELSLPKLVYTYFSQNKKYNDDLLVYLFDSKPDLLIEVLRETNALSSKKHLSRIIENNKLFEFILEKLPEETIWGLRVSQLFLDDEIWSKMTCLISCESSAVQRHYQVFNLLRSSNLNFQNTIKSFDYLFEQPQLLLSYLSVWHAEKKFHQTKNPNPLAGHSEGMYMTAIYNLILEKVSVMGNINFEQDINLVYGMQINPIKELFGKEQISKYWELLDNLLKYVQFKTDILEWYCYDANCVPEVDKLGNIVLKVNSEEEEIRWIKNGMKYEYWNTYHLIKGATDFYSQVTNNPVESKKIYKNESEFALHVEYHSSIFSSRHFFSNLNFNNIDVPAIPKIGCLVHNLEALKWNVVKKDVEPKLNCFNSSSSFKEALVKSVMENKTPLPEIRLEYYEDLILKCINISKVTEEQAKKIIDFHISDLTPRKYCDKQNVKKEEFHVENRPIIKIGNVCFIMPWLFEYITPSHSILNNMFKTIKEKDLKLGLLIEEQVRNEFKNCDFTVRSFGHIGQKGGDYDCLAYKNGTLFVVQVKSTYLRTNLQDNFFYNDREIKKAANQIDRNLIDIHENFPELKEQISISETNVEDLNIVPLIVTTSFEQDGDIIKSKSFPDYRILKTSLFELKVILRGEENNLSSYTEMSTSKAPNLFKDGNKRTDPLDIIRVLKEEKIWSKLNQQKITIAKPILLSENFQNHDSTIK